MTKKAIAVVGAGKFAIDVLKRILAHEEGDVRLVVDVAKKDDFGASLARFCDRLSIPCMRSTAPNSTPVLTRIAEATPDLVFSLNNFRILKAPLLAIPRQGVINFHNGPLPKYGGVNVCSWAIINGESKYGVTWHYMDVGIDTGDIIAQRMFPVAANWTVVDLSRRCIDVGLEMIEEILPALLADTAPRTAQPQDIPRTYYSLRDTPNDGHIDFAQPYATIERLTRGLNYYPLHNGFVRSTVGYKNNRFAVTRVEHAGAPDRDSANAQILQLDNEVIIVNGSDAKIAIVEATDSEGIVLSISEAVARYALRTGDMFS